MIYKHDRRKFLGTLTLMGAGVTLGGSSFSYIPEGNKKPALLGGPRAHPDQFPSWPVSGKREEEGMAEVLQSKKWGRLNGNVVANFENKYKEWTGAKHCVGVSSGTSALFTSLGVLDIGPGDEVIIPVYTFVATYNVVVLNYALPKFVDTDIETFQIDTDKIGQAITQNTKLIMPVHIGGSPADMDSVMDVAEKHKIPVLEDACQAHLAEWKGKKVGTIGLAGAFSFQSSKNLNSGEGGAIITNDDMFANNAYNFHNQSRGNDGENSSYRSTRGTNLRLTEFQGRLLTEQMSRLQEQANRRTLNAQYLTGLLKDIPGIYPAKLYPGVTQSAYHLYMFRFDKNAFAEMPKSRFLEALSAEGVPCSGGYGRMNKENYVQDLAKNRHYLNLYGKSTMQEWLENSNCPQNDLLCEQAVWFGQSMLLGTKKDMEQIAEAILKIRAHAGDLAKS
ncbi:DegT/DnrJ/EryC1/StrS family aminotransferase [Cyclobacterium plantarum]|uniref:DegT/DnrJ/EryC1/StrS family aminotransferase n=1 Tax=Cyclobacterium plantarum TaxID=2716263 RepID=A0ABX0HAF4_9BACT|nr:DegT/DnrJ/EryC1/StrS family aminotransferase [Cyclobacterium plantarum]NHE58345.1 DegT/DnrJ/EryC1/StrS family aminotransferase [Cyclobacterium plantarum]